MALTDINTVTGIYDFIKECKAVAIKPLVRIEFRYNNKPTLYWFSQNTVKVAEMNRFPNPTILIKHPY
jgi:DNA polymerase-3 subunit alpha/error-prone DNA polymerase